MSILESRIEAGCDIPESILDFSKKEIYFVKPFCPREIEELFDKRYPELSLRSGDSSLPISSLSKGEPLPCLRIINRGHICKRNQGRIGTDSIIMTISSDHGSIQSDFLGSRAGTSWMSAEKILFDKSVLFVEEVKEH